MQIETNFIDDIRSGLTAELQQFGHDPPEMTGDARKDAHRVCMAHFNARSRRITPHPRATHWSRELHACTTTLTPDIRKGLHAVDRELQVGDDVTVRLSRQLRKRTLKHDAMLNDWGIQHVHLDAVNRSGGTNEVLFALVHRHDAYLIDVRPHGSWADGDLVEIIHENWPQTIDRFRCNAVRLTFEITDAERRTLRDKHANSAFQTKDGTVYQPMGGGVAMSGANIGAVLWGDHLLEMARRIEDFVHEHVAWVGDLVESEAGRRPDRVALHLLNVSEDHALVYVDDELRQFAFRVPVEKPPRVVIDLNAPSE